MTDLISRGMSKKNQDSIDNTAAVLKSKYKLKCNGTDSVDSLQSALDDLKNIGYNKIVFPPSPSFYLTKSLTIPEGLTLDLNGASITVINSISESPIKIAGSNTKIKNLKLIHENRNYNAKSGVEGIEFKGSKNVDNLFFYNIKVEGFENGINIYPRDGYAANNIKFFNCETNYAEMAGLNVANVSNVIVQNHNAFYNALDGFKTTKNAIGVRVYGGSFSNNVNPVDTYADGIDLYAGASDCIIHGAVCESNGGVGIHTMNGELHDSTYQTPALSPVKHVVIDGCISKNNTVSGFDAVTKLTVSATSPYVSKVIFKGCIAYGNQHGINLLGRNIILSDCILSQNKKHGVLATKTTLVEINNCKVLNNSTEAAGTYAGICLDGCTYVKVNSGTIDGADSDTLQNQDGSALTKYHKYGIEVKNTETSDYIEVNNPTILNFTDTRGVYVNNFAVAGNDSKKIVVKIGDVGTNPLNNQIGSLGSELYRNGRKYLKKTGLNSVEWDLELRTKEGSTNLTADGTATTFTIPHGLGVSPTRYNLIPKTANAAGNHYVATSATNLIIYFLTAPSAGTLTFQWEASV